MDRSLKKDIETSEVSSNAMALCLFLVKSLGIKITKMSKTGH